MVESTGIFKKVVLTKDQRLARGLGLRQPSPARGASKTMAFQLEDLSKALA